MRQKIDRSENNKVALQRQTVDDLSPSYDPLMVLTAAVFEDVDQEGAERSGPAQNRACSDDGATGAQRKD